MDRMGVCEEKEKVLEVFSYRLGCAGMADEGGGAKNGPEALGFPHFL